MPKPARAGFVRKGGSREFAPSMPPAAEIDTDAQIDFSERKRILVAGKDSYIGDSFREWMGQFSNYKVDVLDARGRGWRDADFSGYNALLDVAGVAHVKETRENRRAYYEVNRDLAVALAKKAKREGVPQFVYISTMNVYGMPEGRITRDTKAHPSSAYGKSKAEAESLLWKMNSEGFAVQVVRPPMVYGRGCKGNYQSLRRFALRCKVFPSLENERSMIYIDNLSSALRGVIHYGRGGVYFPQNPSYMQTREMVSGVAALNGRRVALIGILNPVARAAARISGTFRKVFGTLVYDQGMNVPDGWLAVKGNMESLARTERGSDAAEGHGQARG